MVLVTVISAIFVVASYYDALLPIVCGLICYALVLWAKHNEYANNLDADCNGSLTKYCIFSLFLSTRLTRVPLRSPVQGIMVLIVLVRVARTS